MNWLRDKRIVDLFPVIRSTQTSYDFAIAKYLPQSPIIPNVCRRATYGSTSDPGMPHVPFDFEGKSYSRTMTTLMEYGRGIFKPVALPINFINSRHMYSHRDPF